jgi:subtilisin family serine protease
MKGNSKTFFYIKSVLLLLSLCLSLEAYGEESKSRKIVVFHDWFINESAQDSLLNKSGALKHKSLKLINGAAVDLSAQTEKVLEEKKEILRIDNDLTLCAFQTYTQSKKKGPNPQEDQEIPWNIFKVGAHLAWTTTAGKTVRVAVCDTGIDLDHPDLVENIAGEVNLAKPNKSGDDDSGHGTHIAGVVAAVDNWIGVVGVGPNISLYAVKVLDHKGKGWLSDLIDAFDWCIANDIQVINMSFGTLEDNSSFQEAVRDVFSAGIVLVAAAGNRGEEGGEISFPARYPETIAVSAVDIYGNLASFSSYGAEIDLTAPGVEIKSTYENGMYEFMSGTSMSTPHVTGAVALLLTTVPSDMYDINGNGFWDPAEVKLKLVRTAQDLGLDPVQQGAGLVRADEAIR